MRIQSFALRAAWVFLLIGTAAAQPTGAGESPAPAPAAQAEPRPAAALEVRKGGPAPLSIEQIRANLPATAAEKFEFLRNQRKTTLEAVSNFTSQLESVDAKISNLQVSERMEANDFLGTTADVAAELADAKQRLADAEKRHAALVAAGKATPPAQLERASEELDKARLFVSRGESWVKEATAKEKTKVERAKDLDKLRRDRDELSSGLLSYQRLLGSIDDMVNQLFIASDATNSFKLRMSIAFSALVGVVIIGFFAIAWSNDEIKKTIFANEAGIQFITVFSIVIAVILFGIIGVLESKELSALLGGLSGYILGKSRAGA